MSSNESLISSLKTVSPRVENEKNPCIMCRTSHMFYTVQYIISVLDICSGSPFCRIWWESL